ncbi:hypothetical protein KSS87_011967 [Heliosperma pusillum]|nr:hypothetical protein KSS87_011967 [Heliosperma pusillum]
MGGAESVSQKSIHEFTVKDSRGRDVELSIYKGKVLLVVNVASKWSFFIHLLLQFHSIFLFYVNMRPSHIVKYFEILAFPCNQFLKQEPGTSEDAEQFACTRFKAEYPIFQKVRVNGSKAAPVYKFLKAGTWGFIWGNSIKWNFTKFLVDKEGRVLERYGGPDRNCCYHEGYVIRPERLVHNVHNVRMECRLGLMGMKSVGVRADDIAWCTKLELELELELELVSGLSYHESLDHCLYIPGVGHVAPDTYSGYGLLLDSDVDDDTEATSAFYADENTYVPDSLFEEDVIFEEKVSGSGDLSPRSMKFERFCDNFYEKQRKKDENRVVAYKAKVGACADGEGYPMKSGRSGELSPSSMKFKRFCDNFLEKQRKKVEIKGKEIEGIVGGSPAELKFAAGIDGYIKFGDDT